MKKPRRVVVSISIPDELLDRMDKCREALYPKSTRSKYIEKLIINDVHVYELITKARTDMTEEDQ